MNDYRCDQGIYNLTLAPVVEPIGLDEIKAHSRIDITDDDLYIQELILAVRKGAEQEYNLAFLTQTWTLSLPAFPFGVELKINKRPVQSVTKIEYVVDGVTLTLATSVYLADLNFRPPRIVLKIGQSWPSLQQPLPGSVLVTFKAGYGDTADTVPHHLRIGLAARVATLYENRESHTVDVPASFGFIDNFFANERLYSV